MNRQDVEKSIARYLKPIFGFALKRCKSLQDAQDLSQEIAIRAFRSLIVRDDVADMGKTDGNGFCVWHVFALITRLAVIAVAPKSPNTKF